MLELKPVLNKKDLENLKVYNSMPYSQMYREKKENEIFNVVKSVRKENQFPKAKFSENNLESLKNIILTKPKDGSFISQSSTSLFGGGTTIGKPDENIKKGEAGVVLGGVNYLGGKISEGLNSPKVNKAIFEGSKFALNKTMGALEYGQHIGILKPVAGIQNVVGMSYYSGKGFLEETLGKIESIKESKTVKDAVLGTASLLDVGDTFKKGIGRTGEDFELFQAKTDIIYGTNTKELGDYLNFTTSEEKVRKTIEAHPEYRDELKSFADETVASRMGIQVASAVAFGLATPTMIGNVATKVMPLGTKGEKVAKILRGTEEAINKYSLTGLAGMGALTATSAGIHYIETGENLLDGDDETKENILSSLLGPVLIGGGVLLYKGGKVAFGEVRKILDNPTFQEGFNNAMFEIKNAVGNKIDDYATKVGAKINLMEDVTGNVVNVKPTQSKAIQFIDEVGKQKSKNSLQKTIQEKGLWDVNKTPFKNYTKYYYDELTSSFTTNTARRISNLFGKNAKYIEKEITGFTPTGEVNNINDRIAKLAGDLGDDTLDFNAYIQTLSRASKSRNYSKQLTEMQTNVSKLETVLLDKEATDEAKRIAKNEIVKLNKKIKEFEPLKTKYLNSELTEKDLDDVISIYEQGVRGEVFKAKALEFKKINEEVLNIELNAGVRSLDEVNNFKSTNPYYVRDAIVDEQAELFQKGGIRYEGPTKGRKLSGGTDNYSFDIKGFDDVSRSYGYRIQNAYENRAKLDALELSEKLGDGNIGARVLGEKELLKTGETTAEVFINGEKKTIAINKAWEQFIKQKRMAIQFPNSFWKRTDFVATIPTRILKQTTTGRLAPLHSVTQTIPDMINGFLYSVSQKKGFEYIKAQVNRIPGVNFNSFSKNPETRKAMLQIAKAVGADYSYVKGIKDVLEETALERGINKFFSPIGKFIDKTPVVKVFSEDFGHNVEMNWLRIPMIEAGLKDAGLNVNMFNKYIKEADELGMPIEQLLIKKGIDVKSIGKDARDTFNFADASNAMRFIARYIPYANIAAVSATAVKRILTNNPKQALGILSGVATMAQIMYWHNYSGEKGDVLRGQQSYMTHQSGFFLGGDENNFIRVKNIPLLEWIYPMVVELNEANRTDNREFNVKNALQKMVKDVTYVVDLDAKYLGVIQNLTPPMLKAGIENLTNYNSFYGGPLVRKEKPGYELLERDDNTKTGYIKFAELVALSTGGVVNSDGVIEGGYQISPIKLQNFFKSVDPTTKATYLKTVSLIEFMKSEFESIKEGEFLTEGGFNKALKLIAKTYKLKEGSEEDFYNFKAGTIDYVTEYKKEEIAKAFKSGKDDEVKDVVTKYADDKELKNYIVDKIKYKLKEEKWGKDVAKITELTSEQIAQYIMNIKQSGDDKMLEKVLRGVLGGAISDEKKKKVKAEMIKSMTTKKD